MNDTTIVAVPDGVEAAGAIIFWRLSGGLDAVLLEQAWTACGLSAKALPALPSSDVALSRALKDFEAKHVLVRSLSRGRYTFVLEQEADGKLTYSQGTTVSLTAGGEIWVEPYESAHREPVERRFLYARNNFATTDASAWLVRQAETLGAVRLRETGGIYFMPHVSLGRWHQIVSCVRLASAHQIFEIPALKNDEAVAAVLDALTREAEAAAKVMEEKLQGEDIGPRALKTQAKAAKAMLEKVRKYDALLGAATTGIQTRMGDLEAALAAAALAADEKEDA